MADVVLAERAAAAGLDVEVVSSGTGGWHVGDPMDRRAAALLTAHGYDASRHEARRFDGGWFDECDLVLAMDRQNLADVLDAAGPDRRTVLDGERVRLFRDFDPRAEGADREVPDPYYGGDDGFVAVLAMIERTADRIVGLLAELLGRPEAR
ncbi:low molecular weight phosphotyrosine protein phosphatase [Nocardioides mesophilus]|uniref:protein-tyrosine-phosphatase n=2 Tax=Nocardioides mesophilus TaxID=433659 RepID=A0A7G9RH38_9ACTN|nr:low molecular weight phosphotyrosine protein phosphatase [Nocardioides mesophilus]